MYFGTCYISISVHHHNASIYFIDTLGPYVIRMVLTQFNYIATSSLLKNLLSNIDANRGRHLTTP